MSDRLTKIQELIEMQKKFIAYEQENGVNFKDYFTPEAGHPLDGYRQEYMDKAMELVDLAHEDKGSQP